MTGLNSSYWLLFLALWTLGTRAGLIDETSCGDWLEYNSHGPEANRYGPVRSYGNQISALESALSESRKLAIDAWNGMMDVQKNVGHWFNRERMMLAFLALQGDNGDGILDQPRWKTVRSRVKELIKDPLSDSPTKQNIIVCGDAHLKKRLILKGGARVTNPTKEQLAHSEGWIWEDPILKAAGIRTSDWLAPMCEDATSEVKVIEDLYIIVCHQALHHLTIDHNRDINWARQRYRHDTRRYLTYWTRYLSYVFIHELIHFQFKYFDHKLRYPVRDGMTGRLETEAYDWDDTIALLSQGPGLVDNNVDNLAMMILIAFMRQNSWDKNGLARSMGQVANDCSLP